MFAVESPSAASKLFSACRSLFVVAACATLGSGGGTAGKVAPTEAAAVVESCVAEFPAVTLASTKRTFAAAVNGDAVATRKSPAACAVESAAGVCAEEVKASVTGAARVFAGGEFSCGANGGTTGEIFG